MLEGELWKLLAGTGDAAFAVNDQGLICAWNPAAERLLGYASSEVLGRPCASILQGQGASGVRVCSEQCGIIDCALQGHEISNFEMEIKTRSKRRIWVNASILVFRDDRTRQRLLAHILRDINRAKEAEQLTSAFVRVAKKIAVLPETESALPPTPALTDRERIVLRLIAEGKGTTYVSRELCISTGTLRNHLSHINAKLHTHNRLEAVIQAKRRRIL